MLKGYKQKEIKIDFTFIESVYFILGDRIEEKLIEIVCKFVVILSFNSDEVLSLVVMVDILDISRRVLLYFEVLFEGFKGIVKKVEFFYDFFYF